MGLHYVNMDLVGKNKVNPYAPQIVIYEPTPKGPKLIGLDGGLCGSNQMLVGSSKRFRTVLLQLDHFSATLMASILTRGWNISAQIHVFEKQPL